LRRVPSSTTRFLFSSLCSRDSVQAFLRESNPADLLVHRALVKDVANLADLPWTRKVNNAFTQPPFLIVFQRPSVRFPLFVALRITRAQHHLAPSWGERLWNDFVGGRDLRARPSSRCLVVDVLRGLISIPLDLAQRTKYILLAHYNKNFQTKGEQEVLRGGRKGDARDLVLLPFLSFEFEEVQI